MAIKRSAVICLVMCCFVLIIDCEATADGSWDSAFIQQLFQYVKKKYYSQDNLKNLTCSSEVPYTIENDPYYFQWYQVFPGIDNFVTLPWKMAKASKLTIGFEKFDNESIVYSRVRTESSLNKKLLLGELAVPCYKDPTKRIMLPPDEYKNDENIPILKYAEEDQLVFSCAEYSSPSYYVSIVLFYNNQTTMRTFNNMTVLTLKFTKEYNGMTVCCLVFAMYDTKEYQHNIRYVMKKTKIVYDPTAKHTEVNHGNNAITEAGRKIEFINWASTEPVNMQTNIQSTTSIPPATDDSSKSLTVILSVTGGILFLIIVIIILIKKCCWIHPDPLHGVQLPPNLMDITNIANDKCKRENITNKSQHIDLHKTNPFYLNLLFRRECEQEIQAMEEHSYEEIE